MPTDVYYNISDNRDNVTDEKEVEFFLYSMYDYNNDIKLNFQTFKDNVISFRETGSYIYCEHGGLFLKQFSELCDAYEYFSACKEGIKDAKEMASRFSVDENSTLDIKVKFFVKERIIYSSKGEKILNYKGTMIPETKNGYNVFLSNEENLSILRNAHSEINKQVENSFKDTGIHPKNNPEFFLKNWNIGHEIFEQREILKNGVTIFEKEIFSSLKDFELNEKEIHEMRQEIAKIPFYI